MPSIDIEVDEFVWSCSEYDIKELIKVLVENEHLPEGIIDQSGEIKTEYPRKGIMEVDFSEKLEKLKLKYYSLSQEEEEFFDKVFKKYF